MTQIYNDPNDNPSSIGYQVNVQKWDRRALIESREKVVFGNLASMINQPKHMGKKIVRYHYIPLLDNANINDQGIDATGISTTLRKTIKIIGPFGGANEENIYLTKYATGEGADSASATTAAEADALNILVNELGFVGADYATAKADAIAKGTAVDDTVDAVPESGNLYGGSKDIGTIVGKLPSIDENGGRKNRVGYKRKEIRSNLDKFGFFDEYTKESVDFDSDDQLQMHKRREALNGAHEINEDALQIDLLNNAGLVRFGGDAISTGTVTGEGTPSVITYASLRKLSINLMDNHSPLKTTMVTGSKMTDTRTIQGARIAYIGSELQPMLEKMVDDHGDKAFVHAHQYGAATTPLMGEIGSIGAFRFVVAPKMLCWEGAGATVAANEGYRETGGKYDVFPMLIVGDDSFNTVGFENNGKDQKFKIKHVTPESDIAYSGSVDPFGEKGFMSIKWYYGFMAVRPERIAVVKCVAEWG